MREFVNQTPGCVSYAVLFKMAHGRHVIPSQLHKWATAIGEDPDDWYRWGGYPEMARSHPGQGPAGNATSPPAWTPRTEAPDRFTDDEEALDYLIGFYSGEPPQDPTERERLKRIIKATLGVE